MHSIGSSAEDGPALCEDCAVEDGVREGVFLELLGEQRRLEQRKCTANALCMDCHSGGLTGKVLCENGECPVRRGFSSYSRSGARNNDDVTSHSSSGGGPSPVLWLPFRILLRGYLL